jgi:hypothetical protein
MSEPRVYDNFGQIVRKMFSLLVSFKYHAWVVASIGLFTHLIDGWLWAALTGALLSVRGWEKFIWSRVDIANAEVKEVPKETLPEVAPK